MLKSRLSLLTLAFALCATVALAQQPNAPNEKHTFRLETDSGRYGVGAERFDPKQLGVEIYPGAKVDQRENEGKGANLSLDWGRESLRLYVQKYVTTDSADKVLSFYRKQLSKYGGVLECRDGKPVAAVATDLKCEDGQGKRHDDGIKLKAGTENRQHVVGVTPTDEGTDFQIVYVEETRRGEI